MVGVSFVVMTGAEYMLHQEQGLLMSTLTLGGHYKADDFVAGATLSPTGHLNVCGTTLTATGSVCLIGRYLHCL